MKIPCWTCCFFVFIYLFEFVESDLVKKLSFDKPYETTIDGLRQITDDGQWKFGGSTVVNKHFIRLTPDRQSKRGWIWNENLIQNPEFSIILSFRISGQASKWFGDGIGLWITDAKTYISGENHGFTETYKGFGLIFDTFINQEHPGGHQDITYQFNDGTKTIDQLNYENKKGCNAPKLRYHEKNAAFRPSKDYSRVKVQYKNNYLKIYIDDDNKGEWRSCFETEFALSDSFFTSYRGASIGITGSTGSLADNHDILGISFYDKVEDAGHAVLDSAVRNKTSAKDVDVSMIEGSDLTKVNELNRQFKELQEDLEHQLTALKEETENTIAKLKKQEHDDWTKIQHLDEIINREVTQKVESSKSILNDIVNNKIERTVETKVRGSSVGGWKGPFLVLSIIIIIGAFYIYKKYQDLRKSHLL